MFNVNKKLWSFNFGCIVASSFLWLVSYANAAPVPEVLHQHPEFVANYYPAALSILSASLLTGLLIVVMAKGFSICTSEHPFWLLLPSLCLLTLTAISAFSLLNAMLYVAIPALLTMTIVAVSRRLTRRRHIFLK